MSKQLGRCVTNWYNTFNSLKNGKTTVLFIITQKQLCVDFVFEENWEYRTKRDHYEFYYLVVGNVYS